MLDVVEQLDKAIDALSTLDPDTLTDAELDEAVIALQRQRNRLGAVAARLLGRWDRRRVWAEDQSRSAATRLVRDTRCSITTARIELRRARQLQSMPATAAAVTAGDLSLDHVDLLARANQPWRHAVFADHEATLVAECTKLRFPQAKRMVDYWCQRADAETAESDAERQRQAAHLPRLTDPGRDGRRQRGARSRRWHDRGQRTRPAWNATCTSPTSETGSPAPPPSGGRRRWSRWPSARRPLPAKGKRPRPLFTVLVGDESFTRMCELANGQVITPGTLVPWLGTAELETVLFDGPTTVISVSKRRRFTGALRRAIQVRDRHCQHPSGCDEPADRCDVDHIIPVADNGPTSQFAGRIQCWPHNRDATKHDHGAIPLTTPTGHRARRDPGPTPLAHPPRLLRRTRRQPTNRLNRRRSSPSRRSAIVAESGWPPKSGGGGEDSHEDRIGAWCVGGWFVLGGGDPSSAGGWA